MTFNNAKSLLIILSLISIALLGILGLGIYDMRAKNRETSELLNSAETAYEAGILSESIRSAQGQAGEDIRALDDLVLSDDKLVAMIESIEATGRALGLEPSILSVGKNEDKKGLEPDIVRIEMETDGPWAETLSFLQAIESLPQRVMIEESSFTREVDLWHLKIILLLYSFD
jgi:hypothetical protein